MIVSSLVFAPFLLLILVLPITGAAAVTGALMIFMDAGFIHKSIPFGVAWAGALTFVLRAVLETHPALLQKSLLRPETMLLMSVVVVDLVVLVLSLSLFSGKVQVLVGAVVFSNRTVPFELFPQHINQLAYCIACIILTVVIAALTKQRALTARDSLDPGRLGIVMLIGYIAMAAVICSWQQIHFWTGLFYWDDLLHSDQSARAWNQMLNGIDRVTGPYPEPSSLGYHLSGVACFFAALGVLRNPRYLVGAGVAVYLLIVSTSTTAFGGIAAAGLVAAIACALRFGPMSGVYGRAATGNLAMLLSAGAIVLTVGLLVAASSGPDSYLGQVIDNAVLKKSGSSSYNARTLADHIGGEVFKDTYGIGVGLGGHLANSGLVTLLANLGISGVLILAAFAWMVLRSVIDAIASGTPAADPEIRSAQRSTLEVMLASALMLLGLGFLHVLTAPLFSSPLLWLGVGLWLGTTEVYRGLAVAPRAAQTPSLALAPSRLGVAH